MGIRFPGTQGLFTCREGAPANRANRLTELPWEGYKMEHLVHPSPHFNDVLPKWRSFLKGVELKGECDINQSDNTGGPDVVCDLHVYMTVLRYVLSHLTNFNL